MKWPKMVVAAFLLVVTACHRGTVPVAAPPATALIPAALATGDAAYERASFAEAARSYESYLQSNPQTSEMDRVLFRFGVSQSMSGVAGREAASNDTFNRLIRDFPQSPFVPPARIIVALRTDVKTRDDKIRQINAELDKLKKIDLDRRRTP